MKDVFCFSLNSKDELPGYADNEIIQNDINLNYKELVKIKDWRKVLSPLYCLPFKYDMLTWNTIKHAYYAQKIKYTNSDLYYKLSLESHSSLSKLFGNDLNILNEIIKVNKKFLRSWKKIRKKIKRKIYTARFIQSKDARSILILTYNANLFHQNNNKQIIRMKFLEKIRFDFITKYVNY